MNERDELRTADLAEERGDLMGPDRADERRGETMEPDRTERGADPETRDEPERDSWAKEKLAQARDKLTQGPAATVHREDTTREDTAGRDEEPVRERDVPEATAPPERDIPEATAPPEQDIPEVTTPSARMTPDEGADAVGAATVDTASGAAVGPLLPADDAEAFRARWTDIQNGFVDAPRQAVERADGLTAELMQHLAASFADERARLERHWDRGDDVSTDSLRGAFQRYRSFFERLLTT